MKRPLIRHAYAKAALVIGLLYVLIGSFLMPVPRQPILNESIRLLHFHVPMWFGMIILFGISAYHAWRTLKKRTQASDNASESYAHMGIWMGIMGLLSGMLWARYTWGDWWSGDPKQNVSAIALFLYAAYFVLRRAAPQDPTQQTRLAAMYNLLSFALLIPLLFVVPRLTDSLHPGNGGNPGFTTYDLDHQLRWVFYPAVVVWTGIGIWLAQLRISLKAIADKRKASSTQYPKHQWLS